MIVNKLSVHSEELTIQQALLTFILPYIEKKKESRFGAPEHQCSWFLKKKYFCISKNYKIYSLNTYTCFEYLCEVLVEIALYFELQEKNKFVATYRLKFCQKFVFFV
jgi:hypothetical protein